MDSIYAIFLLKTTDTTTDIRFWKKVIFLMLSIFEAYVLHNKMSSHLKDIFQLYSSFEVRSEDIKANFHISCGC